MPFHFSVAARDPGTRARRGTFTTPHGAVETPVFMPVGTRGTVTGLTPADLEALQVRIVLGNTYHLLLRPGPDAMRSFGGLHRFMAWDRPILTDSGGFQIFSLPGARTLTEEGARFKSYVDASYHTLSPERSIEVQTALGSDIMMALDVCLPSTAGRPEVVAAMERTHRWALRSLAARTEPEQALFAIVQGGLSLELRAASAAFLTAHPFDGFAIGGLAVGDTRTERAEVVGRAAELLPEDRPRYLMGVGTPADILEAIAQGVDMFDCVIPTSLAWQGTAFTSAGRVRITRSAYRLSQEPLDAACACATCTLHTRGYLHHLAKCGEPLAPRLLSIHNLQHYMDLMRSARSAIERGGYDPFMRETLAAVDRHEHDATGRPPGRRAPLPAASPSEPVGPPGGRFAILSRPGEAPAVSDRETGEVMHPGLGVEESERLYAGQSGLRERLGEDGPPLVLFDVGLGAGSNALAALRVARAAPGRRELQIVSFDRQLEALELAASDEGAARLQLAPEDREAARALLRRGAHEEPRARWRVVVGELPETLRSAEPRAELVFWDPFSPQRNPELWTCQAFAVLRERCVPGATLFTYSNATAVRTALLLAGFCAGTGAPSGPKEETTAAACRLEDLRQPLDARWLARLSRSSAPFPRDAPSDALARVRAHPQFGGGAGPSGA